MQADALKAFSSSFILTVHGSSRACDARRTSRTVVHLDPTLARVPSG